MKVVVKSLLMLTILLTAACQAEPEDELGGGVAAPLEAEIIAPDTAEPNEELELAVRVTQGGELVDDASDVQFEIWKADDRDNGEMLEAEHVGDGVYQLTHAFTEDGLYSVQTHVSARDLHVMPVQDIAVGDVPEQESAHEQTDNEEDHHDHDAHDHHN
ncbi:FixH family protein [Alkalihalobacillus oceani]|uniref:FixH family protein n=1 Tax=Halalkalibacter oceani TaxID=1653776 RepID=UPI00203D9DE2|nr:FixH family protein [Halalkalibacter oceani]MCM3761189.1 FixH family protein [Halalkalibacter oceani]